MTELSNNQYNQTNNEMPLWATMPIQNIPDPNNGGLNVQFIMNHIKTAGTFIIQIGPQICYSIHGQQFQVPYISPQNWNNFYLNNMYEYNISNIYNVIFRNFECFIRAQLRSIIYYNNILNQLNMVGGQNSIYGMQQIDQLNNFITVVENHIISVGDQYISVIQQIYN